VSSRDLGVNGPSGPDALDGATHHSSSDLRTGTIYGGLEPSFKMSFKACHQQGHRVKWR
jgi:hypothetical protein